MTRKLGLQQVLLAAALLPGVSCAGHTHRDTSAACLRKFAKLFPQLFAGMNGLSLLSDPGIPEVRSMGPIRMSK